MDAPVPNPGRQCSSGLKELTIFSCQMLLEIAKIEQRFGCFSPQTQADNVLVSDLATSAYVPRTLPSNNPFGGFDDVKLPNAPANHNN